MRKFRRYAWIVFALFAVLGTMFGVFPGGWFAEDVDRDATLLTSGYGMVAVVLTVAIAITALIDMSADSGRAGSRRRQATKMQNGWPDGSAKTYNGS